MGYTHGYVHTHLRMVRNRIEAPEINLHSVAKLFNDTRIDFNGARITE